MQVLQKEEETEKQQKEVREAHWQVKGLKIARDIARRESTPLPQ
jgi:hypothetical protein